MGVLPPPLLLIFMSSRKAQQSGWRPLAKWKPSSIILLFAVPVIVVLFLNNASHLSALKFIVPGIWTTIFVTLIAYVVAAILGLILAALLQLKLGDRTLLWFSITSAVILAGSAFLLTRPHLEYSLIGENTGRVAIIQGTPGGMADRVRGGEYPGADGPLTMRAVVNAETAFSRIDTGQMQNAFVPSELVRTEPHEGPEGELLPPDNVIWETTFANPEYQQPGIFLLVIGGLLLALTIAGHQTRNHPLRIVSEMYVDFVRGIPMLVVILYVGFPLQAAIRDATGGFIDMSRVTRGIVGIALGYAAYMAEIFRAGIQAVPEGQTEAARSLGLTPWQTARYVVLPQALRVVIPPLGNEFIAMLKDTSLLSIISVRDITQRAREFQAASFEVFPPFNTVALLYIGLTLAASSVAKTIERRTQWTARS